MPRSRFGRRFAKRKRTYRRSFRRGGRRRFAGRRFMRRSYKRRGYGRRRFNRKRTSRKYKKFTRKYSIKSSKRRQRRAQRIVTDAAETRKVKWTITGGLGAAAGSQTFSTLSGAYPANTTMVASNTALLQPYSSSAVSVYATNVPFLGSADGNTVSNPANAYNFAFNIKSTRTKMHWYNPSNTTAYLTIYSCKCRSDIPGPNLTTLYDDPEELLLAGWNKNFTEGSTALADYTSPANVRRDVTIYESTLFCQKFKIVKKKTFKLKPGQSRVTKLPCKSNRFIKSTKRWWNSVLTQNQADITYEWLKGDYMYMFQVRGADAVGALTSATTTYNIPTAEPVGLSYTALQKVEIGTIPRNWYGNRQNAYRWGQATASGSGIPPVNITANTGQIGMTGNITGLNNVSAGLPYGSWTSTVL